jgi:hypothetical protein
MAGKLTFGADFNSVETPEYREMLNLMEKTITIATYVVSQGILTIG